MSKCSQQNHRELTGRFCSIHSFQLLEIFLFNPPAPGAAAAHKGIVLPRHKEPRPGHRRMNHSPSGRETRGVNRNE